MSGYKPPRWLERMLERVLPEDLSGQGTLGDLAEEFERRALRSPLRARVWYARQTASILRVHLMTPDGADRTFGRADLVMDLRWSVRSILKNPGFAFGVIVVLGLGLGATAAVFSVVAGTLRNTSWWSDGDATVAVWPDRPFSGGELDLYSQNQSVYRTVGAFNELAFAFRPTNGESESVNGVMITPALFRELAVQPALGRALADDDAIPGMEPVVVLGEALWRRAFGADPGIVGGTVEVNGRAFTVVGIQGAAGKAPGGRAELWVPLVLDPRDDDFWPARNLDVLGVLRAGAGLNDAFDDLKAHAVNLTRLFPMFYPAGFFEGLISVARSDESQRRLIATPLLLLLGGTALLMLVTALNVGNLLLGRAIDRRRELAVRTALGASRGRVVGQLLVEGVVWTALALAVGVATGSIAGQGIAALFVGEVVVVSSPITSLPVLLFVAAVSALACLVLSGVPIAHYLRTQRSGLTVKPASAAPTQRSLVMVQASLATLLLVSATLLVATVGNLRKVPLGFEAAGLMTVELSPPEDRVATVPRARALYDRLAERVMAIPGVQAAGMTGWLPLRAQAPAAPINLRAAPVDVAQAVQVPKHMVDPGFFDALQVQPLEGRLLGSQDRALTPSAVVVNRTMAEMLWPGVSPIGRFIAIDPHAWDDWVQVVGVIPDIRSGEITNPAGPAMYVPLAESPSRDVTLVVRAAGSSSALIPMIRRAVTDVDRLVPIRAAMSMEDVVRAAYSTSWVMMGLLIVLALLATGLGAVGIYAVLAHHVALNKKEIGVRMALGAQPGAVIGGIVRSGVVLAGIGILLGSGGAVVSTRFLESLLFGVSALAPWAFIMPAVALLGAAAIAGVIPAAQAGSLPPAEVLRNE
jgi:putative ABC transport system permease protein